MAVLFVVTAPWSVGGREVGRLPVAFAPALLVLVGCGVAPSWRRAVGRAVRRRWNAPRKSTLLVFLASSAFFGRVTLGLFRALMVNAWDFSVFELPITRSLSQGFLYSPIEGRSFLGTHASYVLALFIPLYAIAASPYWLLAAHAFALSGAVALAFVVCRRVLKDDAAALLLAAAFALNSYTAKIAQYPFHVEVLYTVVVLLLCLAVRQERWVLLVAGCAALFAIKEDSILVAFGLALVLVVAGRRPRRFAVAAAVAFSGAAVYLVSARLVMPAAAHAPPGQAWYAPFWSRYGPTPLAAAAGLLTHPLRVVGDLGRSGIASLLETFLFLPLAGFEWLLFALPALVVYGVADGGRSPIAHFTIYYSAPVIGVIVVAAAKGMRRVALRLANRRPLERLARARSYRRLLAGAVLVVSALDGPSYVFRAAKAERKDIASMVRLAPSSLPLRIQGSLFPHAGYALHLGPLAKLEATGGESILLDPRSNPFPFAAGEIEAFIDARSRDPRYAVTRSPLGLVLLTPAESMERPEPGP